MVCCKTTHENPCKKWGHWLHTLSVLKQHTCFYSVLSAFSYFFPFFMFFLRFSAGLPWLSPGFALVLLVCCVVFSSPSLLSFRIECPPISIRFSPSPVSERDPMRLGSAISWFCWSDLILSDCFYFENIFYFMLFLTIMLHILFGCMFLFLYTYPFGTKLV